MPFLSKFAVQIAVQIFKKKPLIVEYFNTASMSTWMIAMIHLLRFLLRIYYDKYSIISSGSCWVANILLKHIKSTVEYTWERIKKSSLGRCWSNCLCTKRDHLRNTYTAKKSPWEIYSKNSLKNMQQKKPIWANNSITLFYNQPRSFSENRR